MKIYTNDFKCEKYDNLYFEYEGNDSFLYVSDKIYKLDGENYYEIDFMINTKNEAYEYKVNNTTYLVDPENVVFKKLDVPLMYIDKQHYVINEKHFVYRVDENIALIKNILYVCFVIILKQCSCECRITCKLVSHFSKVYICCI